jgi:hypothetical protein
MDLHRRKSHAEAGPSPTVPAPVPGQPPARLLNNAAVLELRAGEVIAAKAVMEEAMCAAVAAQQADLSVHSQVRLSAGPLSRARVCVLKFGGGCQGHASEVLSSTRIARLGDEMRHAHAGCRQPA